MTDLRVTGLRYVALAGPEFAPEHQFIRDLWGLREVGRDGELAWFAAEASDEPFVFRLRGAPERRLDLIGFSAQDAASVDAIAERLARAGVKLLGEPGRLASPGGGYGFRCFDADGHVVEVSSEVAPRQARPLGRGESIPATLSHVVLHSPDLKKSEAFYEEQLGFRLSDRLGDFMSFLRCSAIHHSLAFIPGPPALNHIAFEMRDIDEMMRGAGRLMKQNVTLDWGPGRHVAGNNGFCYFHDRMGNTLEYTAEVDRVDESWQPTVYAPTPEITDQWGTSALTGGPQRMGKPVPDPGVWQAPPV